MKSAKDSVRGNKALGGRNVPSKALDEEEASSTDLSDPRPESENIALRFLTREERKEEIEEVFLDKRFHVDEGGGMFREQTAWSSSHRSHVAKGLLLRHMRAMGAK